MKVKEDEDIDDDECSSTVIVLSSADSGVCLLVAAWAVASFSDQF